MAYRARGEGTIARRKNGTYEGKLSAKDRDGAPLRKSFYGHSRAEVAEKMREYRARNVGLDARFRAALGDFLMSWLDSLDVRPNTFKLRRHFIQKHIVPHIGARPLCDVTSDDVRVFASPVAGRLRRRGHSKVSFHYVIVRTKCGRPRRKDKSQSVQYGLNAKGEATRDRGA